MESGSESNDSATEYEELQPLSSESWMGYELGGEESDSSNESFESDMDYFDDMDDLDTPFVGALLNVSSLRRKIQENISVIERLLKDLSSLKSEGNASNKRYRTSRERFVWRRGVCLTTNAYSISGVFKSADEKKLTAAGYQFLNIANKPEWNSKKHITVQKHFNLVLPKEFFIQNLEQLRKAKREKQLSEKELHETRRRINSTVNEPEKLKHVKFSSESISLKYVQKKVQPNFGPDLMYKWNNQLSPLVDNSSLFEQDLSKVSNLVGKKKNWQEISKALSKPDKERPAWLLFKQYMQSKSPKAPKSYFKHDVQNDMKFLQTYTFNLGDRARSARLLQVPLNYIILKHHKLAPQYSASDKWSKEEDTSLLSFHNNKQILPTNHGLKKFCATNLIGKSNFDAIPRVKYLTSKSEKKGRVKQSANLRAVRNTFNKQASNRLAVLGKIYSEMWSSSVVNTPATQLSSDNDRNGVVKMWKQNSGIRYREEKRKRKTSIDWERRKRYKTACKTFSGKRSWKRIMKNKFKKTPEK